MSDRSDIVEEIINAVCLNSGKVIRDQLFGCHLSLNLVASLLEKEQIDSGGIDKIKIGDALLSVYQLNIDVLKLKCKINPEKSVVIK